MVVISAGLKAQGAVLGFRAYFYWLDVAEKCEFYTCAEIEHLVNEAARSAVRTPRLITEADMIKAIESNPPAFDLQRIDNMKAHIGFV